MTRKIFIPYLVILSTFALFGSLASCSDDDPVTPAEGRASLTVKMTDAPTDYDSVMINVQGVRVKIDSEDNEENWSGQDWEYTGWINLLDFTNGRDTVILDADVPVGTLKEIRLILGEGNYVIKNGQKMELTTPSAQTSGLKIKIDKELVSQRAYTFILDFDADKSIVETGNGKLNLKPVIRGWAEGVLGAIQGNLTPVEKAEYSFVVNSENDTLKSYPEQNGYFRISGVETGQYMLYIKIINTDPLLVLGSSVSVTAGQITDVGTINID